MNLQFEGCGLCRKAGCTDLGQELANDVPVVVFHPASLPDLGDAAPQTPWDLTLWSLKRQGHAGLGMPSPTCCLQASSQRSGCIPAEPYLPLKHPSNKRP